MNNTEMDRMRNEGERNRDGKQLIAVRGGGDLATGTIHMLSTAGYAVVVLECGNPTAIRREAAFSEAVRLGTKTVEGITCDAVASAEEALRLAGPDHPVLLIDEKAESLGVLKPRVLVDAMIAKRNLGTRIDMADYVIALGPGFTAGKDAHAVIETMRGHNLGRVIYKGQAQPNTGIPGLIAGYGKERVLHAPKEGVLHPVRHIGDVVEKGETIAVITGSAGEEVSVEASLTGVLRGMLPDGFAVRAGLKMADIDPRLSERENCFSISDKSRCIAGSVLMLVCRHMAGAGGTEICR